MSPHSIGYAAHGFAVPTTMRSQWSIKYLNNTILIHWLSGLWLITSKYKKTKFVVKFQPSKTSSQLQHSMLAYFFLKQQKAPDLKLTGLLLTLSLFVFVSVISAQGSGMTTAPSSGGTGGKSSGSSAGTGVTTAATSKSTSPGSKGGQSPAPTSTKTGKGDGKNGSCRIMDSSWVLITLSAILFISQMSVWRICNTEAIEHAFNELKIIIYRLHLSAIQYDRLSEIQTPKFYTNYKPVILNLDTGCFECLFTCT